MPCTLQYSPVLHLQVYKFRLRMILEPFLVDADDRAKTDRKKAYCHLVGHFPLQTPNSVVPLFPSVISISGHGKVAHHSCFLRCTWPHATYGRSRRHCKTAGKTQCFWLLTKVPLLHSSLFFTPVCPGLGLGVWMVAEAQGKLMVEVYAEILKERWASSAYWEATQVATQIRSTSDPNKGRWAEKGCPSSFPGSV